LAATPPDCSSWAIHRAPAWPRSSPPMSVT
jgi:hypothetical protein